MFAAMSGVFITFEGIEGSGKSTQIHLLEESLKRRNLDLLLTREPGGTAIGEKIRSILLDAAHAGMAPVAELLLYAASRNQHVEEVIRPALGKGRVVLCDRYADATAAYQGAARNIDPDVIADLYQIATGGLAPDLTLLLDCPEDMGLGRARARNSRDPSSCNADRFEREELDFHRRVREGYLAIARAEPNRVVVVDSTKEKTALHAEIVAIVDKVLIL